MLRYSLNRLLQGLITVFFIATATLLRHAQRARRPVGQRQGADRADSGQLGGQVRPWTSR